MEMFKAEFDSLHKFSCPDWYRDAKFGIWSHWGPQSVACCGDWYARNMYQQDTPQYNHHVRVYGHPSKFGYKDLCALWKAENFDPAYLMDKYVKAGARFFVAQAVHHDNFFNYDSDINRFNSVKIGPGKDICAMWKKEAQRHGIPFGITEHLAYSYSWWRTNKGCDQRGRYKGVLYDGSDPEYKDFYHDNFEYKEKGTIYSYPLERMLTQNENFRSYWLDSVKEMIDRLSPDLLYSDSPLPFGEEGLDNPGSEYAKGLEAVSYLYNRSIEKNGYNKALYTQKDRRSSVYKVGVLDYERNLPSSVPDEPWQYDTCIGGWFYDPRIPYKTTGHIIGLLCDVISRNGTLLLNIIQKPDGSLDEEADQILDDLAAWFSINAEAVYGTRPYRVCGEGPNISFMAEDRGPAPEEPCDWKSDDFRFVQKDSAVYVFALGAKGGDSLNIKSLASVNTGSVSLLGAGPVAFEAAEDGLRIKLPEVLPSDYVNVFKVLN